MFRLVLAFILLTGCAHYNYDARIEHLGEYRDSTPAEENFEKMEEKEAKGIKVFIGTPPKGLIIKDDKLTSEDAGKYQVISKILIKHYDDLIFYPYHEDEKWKRTYCGVQQPLVILTLFIWRIVPIYYPCWVGEGNSGEEVAARRKRIINAMKKAAKAAGGNAVVITAMGDLETVYSNQNKVVAKSTKEMISAEGYAIQMK